MYNKKDAMNGVSTKFQDRFRVKSTRLKYWDYNSCGGYFVTICVKEYTCMFGNIENGQMVLSELGKEAKKFWDQIPKHFSHAHMDEYVFMPNHMHGIIMIEPVRRDAIYGVSIQESKPKNGGIVDLKHNWALPYCNRGVLYDNQGNFNQALSDFAKAIELNPNMAEAYYNRSALYFDQGNFIYALMDLNKTIELNPNMAEAYNNRGAIYFKDKNLIKAVSDFSKAIELEPNDEEAYCNRGDVNLINNEEGNPVAHSKEVFANNILNNKPPFDNFNFNEFKEIFQIISDIYRLKEN